MGLIKACKVTAFVRAWLGHSQAVSVLHVFERACNLINEQGEIVSLVTAELGPGPFAVVLRPVTTPIFAQLVTATPVAIDGRTIKLGALEVDTAPAVDWWPRPAWEQWRRRTRVLAAHLPCFKTLVQARDPADNEIAAAYRRVLAFGHELLLAGLAASDADTCRQGAQQLAGLGPGLTPAGDDFLIGASYGLWATRPAQEAQSWAHVIAETAAPHTTPLSVAWLRAAARGEASDAWHELVRVSGQWTVESGQWTVGNRRLLGQCGCEAVVAAVERILNMGHTSGADALAGFIAVLEQGT